LGHRTLERIPLTGTGRHLQGPGPTDLHDQRPSRRRFRRARPRKVAEGPSTFQPLLPGAGPAVGNHRAVKRRRPAKFHAHERSSRAEEQRTFEGRFAAPPSKGGPDDRDRGGRKPQARPEEKTGSARTSRRGRRPRPRPPSKPLRPRINEKGSGTRPSTADEMTKVPRRAGPVSRARFSDAPLRPPGEGGTERLEVPPMEALPANAPPADPPTWNGNALRARARRRRVSLCKVPHETPPRTCSSSTKPHRNHPPDRADPIRVARGTFPSAGYKRELTYPSSPHDPPTFPRSAWANRMASRIGPGGPDRLPYKGELLTFRGTLEARKTGPGPEGREADERQPATAPPQGEEASSGSGSTGPAAARRGQEAKAFASRTYEKLLEEHQETGPAEKLSSSAAGGLLSEAPAFPPGPGPGAWPNPRVRGSSEDWSRRGFGGQGPSFEHLPRSSSPAGRPSSGDHGPPEPAAGPKTDRSFKMMMGLEKAPTRGAPHITVRAKEAVPVSAYVTSDPGGPPTMPRTGGRERSYEGGVRAQGERVFISRSSEGAGNPVPSLPRCRHLPSRAPFPCSRAPRSQQNRPAVGRPSFGPAERKTRRPRLGPSTLRKGGQTSSFPRRSPTNGTLDSTSRRSRRPLEEAASRAFPGVAPES